MDKTVEGSIKKTKTVLIVGATGMVGALVLQEAFKDDGVGRIISLVRRKTNGKQGKLQEIVISDFLQLDSDVNYFKNIDVVFYCLSVYTGSVPRAEFRTITVTYPAKLAEILKEKNPDCRFCLLSGMGADRAEKSKVMFARDKGMIENYLSNIGLAAFHAFRLAYIYPTIKRKEPNCFHLVYRRMYPIVKWLGPAYSITS